MIYRILADSVMVIHLAFVIFVVFGGLLALRWRRVVWLHIPALTWGALIELMGWPCPLTPLEVHLRELGGQSGYEGGFIEHYIGSLLYAEGLTRGLHIALGVGLLLVNTAVYVAVYRRWSRRRAK